MEYNDSNTVVEEVLDQLKDLRTHYQSRVNSVLHIIEELQSRDTKLAQVARQTSNKVYEPDIIAAKPKRKYKPRKDRPKLMQIVKDVIASKFNIGEELHAIHVKSFIEKPILRRFNSCTLGVHLMYLADIGVIERVRKEYLHGVAGQKLVIYRKLK